jgi:hypothetical protein
MAPIDEVRQGRAEQFGLLGWRQFRRHRRSPARRPAEGITPPRRLQQWSGFARFSSAADRDLAIANTSIGQKAEQFRGLQRCSRATWYPPEGVLTARGRAAGSCPFADVRKVAGGCEPELASPTEVWASSQSMAILKGSTLVIGGY